MLFGSDYPADHARPLADGVRAATDQGRGPAAGAQGERRAAAEAGTVPGDRRRPVEPPADLRESTEVGRFMNWLGDGAGPRVGGVRGALGWSVGDLEGFWKSIAEFFAIRFQAPYERVLADREMPGARWFEGARAQLRRAPGRSRGGPRPGRGRRPLSDPGAGRADVRRAARAGGPRARGVCWRWGSAPATAWSRTCRTFPETLVAFIATASLGATWAACAPEFGARSVTDRFAQIEPKVLLTVGGYGYRDRYVDRRSEVAGDPRAATDARERGRRALRRGAAARMRSVGGT